MKKFYFSSKNSVEEFDLFGEEYSFTHRGRKTHKTIFGGIISILAISYIVHFAYFQFIAMYYNDYNFKRQIFANNVILNPSNYIAD